MSLTGKKSASSTVTLLDKGCEFNGKLSFEGVVRIDGVFQGEIFSQDHLIIGDGAVVEADLQVGVLEVGGQFKGTILTRERLCVHSTGKIQGDIKTPELEVHKGAVIDGVITMTGAQHSSLGESLPQESAVPQPQVVRFGS